MCAGKGRLTNAAGISHENVNATLHYELLPEMGAPPRVKSVKRVVKR
jgi:hypothetical protein